MNNHASVLSHLKFRLKANRSLALWLVSMLLGSSLITGCAQIRKLTYPKNFVYLEQKQITSQMAMLSLYMRQLDKILLDDTVISSDQQAQIVRVLSLIDASADALGAGSVETNHLVIDDHIDQFKSDVNLALSNARADPPNYFALGKLSGSCAACHQYRKF